MFDVIDRFVQVLGDVVVVEVALATLTGGQPVLLTGDNTAAAQQLASQPITALVIWDVTGHLPFAGHEGPTVIVGLKGLPLLCHKAWRTAAHQVAQLLVDTVSTHR